jgi:hypothetical protein
MPAAILMQRSLAGKSQCVRTIANPMAMLLKNPALLVRNCYRRPPPESSAHGMCFASKISPPSDAAEWGQLKERS